MSEESSSPARLDHILGSLAQCLTAPQRLGKIRRAVTAAAEELENRVLLSGYVLSSLPMGTNETGSHPFGVIADGNGNLFGTTFDGGQYGYGTVFEIPSGTATVQTLASFDKSHGANPNAPLSLDAGGNLYGTTSRGGSADFGTVFEIPYGTGIILTLASFDETFGRYGHSVVTPDTAGNLYGTTSDGGTSAAGSVFKIARGSGNIQTLASFDNVSSGSRPHDGVTPDAQGNLYGTTSLGGQNGYGTIFKIPRGTTTIQTLASFNSATGSTSAGLTLDAGGNLFGTTARGGTSGTGAVFKLPSGSAAIEVLASFGGQVGEQPWAGLTLDGSGNLYGTTSAGGANNAGTVFEIPKGSRAVTALASFDGTTHPSSSSALALTGAGTLFGVATVVGTAGVVFQVTGGSHAIQAVASFSHTAGINSYGALAFDPYGNLYGTAFWGRGLE